MDYQKLFTESNLSYTDVAHELGCCELTARKKINGNTRITRAEEIVLNNLFKGDDEKCMISKHNR